MTNRPSAAVPPGAHHIGPGIVVKPGDTLVVALGDLPVERAREIDDALTAELPGIRVLCVRAINLAAYRTSEQS